MKRLLALLLTLLLALTSGFALAEDPPVENEDIASILSSLLDSIQEKAEEAISDKIGEVTGTLSDKIGEAAENIPDKANELIEKLPDQVQEIICKIGVDNIRSFIYCFHLRFPSGEKPLEININHLRCNDFVFTERNLFANFIFVPDADFVHTSSLTVMVLLI